MQDVAELISVKRQYIHKIENEKENKSLSKEQIGIIAKRLGVDSDYFFSSNRATIGNDRLHFRSLTIPNYIRERARIYAEDVVSVYLFIRDYIEPLGLEFPAFELEERFQDVSISSSSLHKSDIERITLKIREHLNIGHGPISNMVRLLEVNGVVVSTAKGISPRVDAFCNDDIIPVVMRNDSKSPVRCRFDLAHELGHLVLHKGMTNCIDEKPLLEKQANHFASCLLLPKETLVSEFPRFTKSRIPWESLLELKFRWKVSIAALIMRGYEIGLIDDAARRKAFMHLSHKGWRSCEPGDVNGDGLYVELERPELMRNAVRMLIRSYPDFLPAMKGELKLGSRVLKTILGMPDLDENSFDSEARPELKLIK